jgi:hypothetical protein
MRSIIAAGAMALSLAGAAAAQTAAPAEVAGEWQGYVKVNGQDLPLVYHLGLQVTGDSPAEARYGIKGELQQTDGKYKVSLVSAGEFEGVLKDGKLEGTYTRGNLKAPLVLERKAAEAKPAN